MSDLEYLIGKLAGLDQKALASVVAVRDKALKDKVATPNPGPQTRAYLSPADVLLYGGEPGGGKTALGLILAFNEHKRSLIMRRRYSDLAAICDEAIKLNGTRDGFNGSIPPKLRTRAGHLIEFGAAHNLGSEDAWQGQPHSLLIFDEATQFAESQVRFLMTWVRSTDAAERCRVLMPTNPPRGPEGRWIIGYFRPWLDPTHPRPAGDGELRWFATLPDGSDLEVESPTPIQIGQRTVTPRSRSFIRSTLADNPYLVNTGYQATLDAMAERHIAEGDFAASWEDQENQVIPLAWIQAAHRRWTPQPPAGVPMCAMAVDPACGGKDETVLAWRHDYWFAPPLATPGAQTPLGSDVAALVIKHRRDNCPVIIDQGGGYGGSPMEHLRANGVEVVPYRGSEGTKRRSADRMYGFTNRRSETLWRFREALDPSQPGGSAIMLPDDPELTADLTAPTFEVTLRGIKVEAKEDVCDRLGRSTDRGDAVMMALVVGLTHVTNGGNWHSNMTSILHHPKVILGREAARRRRH